MTLTFRKGEVVGPEILVNTATANAQDSPQTTVLANACFVVTRSDSSQGVGRAGGDASAPAEGTSVRRGRRPRGWSSNDTYPRLLGDVNQDGASDIVGNAGGALSNGFHLI